MCVCVCIVTTICYEQLGKIYLSNGSYSDACKYFRKALKNAMVCLFVVVVVVCSHLISFIFIFI